MKQMTTYRTIRRVLGCFLRQMNGAARRFMLCQLGGMPSTFTLDGQMYPYFIHPYNRTWTNERAVEVSLASNMLSAAKGKRVLEVGNVLYHYALFRHIVVDKYEHAPGVLTVDVVDFATPERFDRILSISTLEHVGWDETPRDPNKAMRAIAHLRSLLAPGGSLLATVPLGYNPHLDVLLMDDAPFDRVSFLRRVSDANEWRQVDREEARGTTYDYMHGRANALAVGYASAQ